MKDGKRVDALYVVFERGVREYYSLNVMFQLREKNITLIALTHTARKSRKKSILEYNDVNSDTNARTQVR